MRRRHYLSRRATVLRPQQVTVCLAACVHICCLQVLCLCLCLCSIIRRTLLGSALRLNLTDSLVLQVQICGRNQLLLLLWSKVAVHNDIILQPVLDTLVVLFLHRPQDVFVYLPCRRVINAYPVETPAHIVFVNAETAHAQRAKGYCRRGKTQERINVVVKVDSLLIAHLPESDIGKVVIHLLHVLLGQSLELRTLHPLAHLLVVVCLGDKPARARALNLVDNVRQSLRHHLACRLPQYLPRTLERVEHHLRLVFQVIGDSRPPKRLLPALVTHTLHIDLTVIKPHVEVCILVFIRTAYHSRHTRCRRHARCCRCIAQYPRTHSCSPARCRLRRGYAELLRGIFEQPLGDTLACTRYRVNDELQHKRQ